MPKQDVEIALTGLHKLHPIAILGTRITLVVFGHKNNTRRVWVAESMCLW